MASVTYRLQNADSLRLSWAIEAARKRALDLGLQFSVALAESGVDVTLTEPTPPYEVFADAAEGVVADLDDTTIVSLNEM